MSTNPRRAAALWYARHGWLVFAAHTPTANGCSCVKKKSCDDIAKHPRWDRELLPHGVKNATTDEATIRMWWKQWPQANVGICTGRQSGIFVLDVDPDGFATLQRLQEEHGLLPETVEAITGRGGSHLLFAHPGEPMEIKNSVKELGPGLDVRGDGGYVIAAPSLHVSGQHYAWKDGHSPKELEPAQAPDWLIPLIIKHKRRQEREAPGERIPKGARNKTLFKNACAMRRRGLSCDAILAALRIENAQRCDPPLPEDDLEKIAASASTYDPTPSSLTARIRINDRQLPDITKDALLAIAGLHLETPTQPLIYVRSGALQRIMIDEEGHHVLELLTESPLRGILARAAEWYSEHASKDGAIREDDEFPPIEVIRDILSLGSWPDLPPIGGIVHAPVFGKDGILHQEPGYNALTRLYQAGSVRLGDVTPTPENIEAAKTLILTTWWGDFPFKDDASKAHALAVVITSFVRQMIFGPVPLTPYG
jgi:hypothetical protein